MPGAARGIMSANRGSHSTPHPTYSIRNDSSLNRLSDPIKAKKKQLQIAIIVYARAAYDLMTDTTATLMFMYPSMLIFPPTVIGHLIYYGIKGIKIINQYERLIEVVKAIGTTSPLGKKFIFDEFRELFQTLRSGSSEELMSLLVQAYRLNQEVTGYKFSLEPINQYITFFTKEKLKAHFIPDLANLIADYSKDAPKIEEKKSSNGSVPSLL